jgi:hypothetical protein
MYTRFEHSLGVMHVATRLYEGIATRSQGLLQSELAYNEDGLQRELYGRVRCHGWTARGHLRDPEEGGLADVEESFCAAASFSSSCRTWARNAFSSSACSSS